jgi:hypothetical protein
MSLHSCPCTHDPALMFLHITHVPAHMPVRLHPLEELTHVKATETAGYT